MSSVVEATEVPSRNRNQLLALLGGATLACAVGILIGLAIPTTSESASTVEGNLIVDTMYETAPNRAEGGKMPAQRVKFFPTYVVVTSRSGTRYVYAVERLRRMTIEEAPKQQ